jgi:hypothetical protein
LRDYIDRLRSERSRIIRERIILDNNYNESEQSAPFLAPNWTKSGYNGKLKDAVVQACQPGRTSAADNTAEATAVPDQPDNSTSAVTDQPDNSTAVPDQRIIQLLPFRTSRIILPEALLRMSQRHRILML